MIATAISGSSTRGAIRLAPDRPSLTSLRRRASVPAAHAASFPAMLIVDIRHWLTDDLSLPDDPPRLRRNALRIASFIEYGGPLRRFDGRETLVSCKHRPRRKPCPGLMWVMKRDDDRIEAFCFVCRETEAII